MTSQWYSSGFSKTQEAAETVKKMRESRNDFLPRFFLKPNSSKNLVFLDDRAFEIYEHNLKLNGKYNNFYTCIGENNGCPLCRVNKAYYVALFSVIDLTGWVDKTGATRDQNRKMIFAAKADVAMILKRQKEMRPEKSLTGCQFNVMRMSSTDFSTGSQFVFAKRYNPESLEKNHPPFVYEKEMAPISIEKLNHLAESIRPSSEKNDSSKQNTQDQGFQNNVNSGMSPNSSDSLPFESTSEIPF